MCLQGLPSPEQLRIVRDSPIGSVTSVHCTDPDQLTGGSLQWAGFLGVLALDRSGLWGGFRVSCFSGWRNIHRALERLGHVTFLP